MSEAAHADWPFTGALASFAEGLRWLDNACPPQTQGAAPTAVLTRFHQGSGGPWRAACSLWGHMYFNALLIPATCRVAAGWPEDFFAEGFSASFCPGTAAPLRFLVHGERRDESGPQTELAFVERLEIHVGRVIDDLAEAGRLSKAMLWEGAGQSLRWAAAQMAGEPALTLRLQSVARRLQQRSRFARPWMAASEDSGALTYGRRLCCLRYQITGCACLSICPRRVGARA